MKFPILFLLIFVTISVKGQTKQSFGLNFNHQALLVRDVDKSASFYADVLGLQDIENRTKKDGRRWLSMGNGTELHLIVGDPTPVYITKFIHFALTANDFEGFVNNLKSRKIAYSSWDGEDNKITIRADGVGQVYIQDLDGYWVEINSAGKVN